MKRQHRILTAVLLAFALIALCAGQAQPPAATAPAQLTDRSGFQITPPENPERIIAISPALCEILVGIGLGDNIIATDTMSFDVEGIAANLPAFDMAAPDVEKILELEPDIVFVSGLSQIGTDDPLKSLKDMGVCVAYVPSSESIEGIYEDIRFISQAVGKPAEGESIISAMKGEIEEVVKVASAIPESEIKTVIFEVSNAPIYSFGSGTYMHEMIEITGAKNALGGMSGWLMVVDEEAVALNPDVILTNVSYIDDPVADILARPGFAEVTAVKAGAVYQISANPSSRPSQHIIIALREMARAIYPEYFN